MAVCAQGSLQAAVLVCLPPSLLATCQAPWLSLTSERTALRQLTPFCAQCWPHAGRGVPRAVPPPTCGSLAKRLCQGWWGERERFTTPRCWKW